MEVRFAAHDEHPTPIDNPGRPATCLIQDEGNLMGGFAVDIDWDRPTPHGRVDAMLALTPHRSTGGTARSLLTHAALGESRTDEAAKQPSIVTDGRFSIVGDLRLWSKDGLRARAGGDRATDGMDDRRLLMAAYARTGIGFLDDVDGDFAFAIWDDQRRRVLAVRDRFATKPLYHERTPTGIRLATEAKQLVATSSRPPTPNDAAVAEFLAGSYRSNSHTFFEGISRLEPAHYLLADEERIIEHEYWTSTFESTALTSPDQVASEFRERLIESVQRRVATSHGVVAHLSGGLDSSSITAAAAVASSRGALPTPFETVSAVFPGEPADESLWIDEIVAGQPFAHHDFIPAIETLEAAEDVMWDADGPLHNRIRGIWSGTAEIANATGADLILMGSGGDEAADQSLLLSDLLRQRRLAQWRSGVVDEADFYGWPHAISAAQSIRGAIPASLKRPFRAVRTPPLRVRTSLANVGLLAEQVETGPSSRYPLAPSETQRLAVASPRGPLRCLINEVQEAEYAREGVSVTYPFLDRNLLEFVASVPPRIHPFDGRSKALIRQAFRMDLPRSVLDRRSKTTAGAYLDGVFRRVAPHYLDRYPSVSSDATSYIDNDRYVHALSLTGSRSTPRAVFDALWNAWTLMHWLDAMPRYRG